MKCELTINADGQITVTDETGYSMAFGALGMNALVRMVQARNASPSAKLGEAGKPSAVQIHQFIQEKARKEVIRKASIADEILALIDLTDLDLSL